MDLSLMVERFYSYNKIAKNLGIGFYVAKEMVRCHFQNDREMISDYEKWLG